MFDNLCKITRVEKQNETESKGVIQYSIDIVESHQFTFCKQCYNKSKFEDTIGSRERIIYRGLLANKKWNPSTDEVLHISDSSKTYGRLLPAVNLLTLLKERDYPRTPKELLDHLFLMIYNEATIGTGINIQGLLRTPSFLYKTYLGNIKEGNLFLNALITEGVLDVTYTKRTKESSGKQIPIKVAVNYKGLLRYNDMMEEGEKSNKVFVAMAFQDDTDQIKSAIVKACEETGYSPVIINQKHVASDKTINDAIISEIRKCKFCIADFTHHRNGVYFESGFALGLGRKVIYTCRKDEFKNAHFDIRPLQHIIYETTEKLEKDLINKIEAWIKY